MFYSAIFVKFLINLFCLKIVLVCFLMFLLNEENDMFIEVVLKDGCIKRVLLLFIKFVFLQIQSVFII